MDIGIFIPLIGVSIPVIAILSVTANRYIKLHEKQIDLAANQAAQKAARYAANGAMMEQRIRVLERIVTDRASDLSSEIDGLGELPDRAKLRSH